ncbi:hypothetical protein E4U57_001371 [Claviceps arundinis]|uniref:Chromo domain-containing protein n=1 Tax=Claviceps arundinis TaxID=1623583 RepID=A0ABQ7PL15_9HYPO|nr:hypothetical protein E4U57_001371 [Claviceps arundinis]
MEAMELYNRSRTGKRTTGRSTARSTPSLRSSVVVAIRSRPRYIPGTGPALQPPRLLPLAASTGYIIERILLPSPGLAADGRPLSKRMTYIVGWRDLPAASLRVPAMDILDYVSQRTLEEWEERLEDEMDEHRQHLGQKVGRWGKHKVSPGMRRRPPAHTEIEQPAAIEIESESESESESETGSDVESHAKSHGMSLSTPRKRRRADFHVSSDEDSNSPTKQLNRELHGNSDGGEDMIPDNVVDLRQGKTVEVVVDLDLKRGDDVDMATNKPLRIVTPVPLPPFITCKFSSTTTNNNTNNNTTRETNVNIDHTRAASDSKRTVVDSGTASLPKPSPKKEKKQKVMHSKEDGTLSQKNASLPANVAIDNAIQRLPTRGSSRGRRKQPTSMNQPPAASAHTHRHSELTGTRKKTQRTTTPPPPSPQMSSPSINSSSHEADDLAWEVERLEDMALYHVQNHGLIRHFLVRWVGEWPPEQNPSWEPEHNLHPDLVRNYMKMAKKKRAKLAAQHQRPPPDPSKWAPGRHPDPVRRVSFGEAREIKTEEDEGASDVLSGGTCNYALDNQALVVTKSVRDSGHGQRRGKETPVPLPPGPVGIWAGS